MSRVIDGHRQYLSDTARVSAFQSAIAERVKPGDIVLDLGSGTGILGLFACRAGASRVYAIDAGGMAQPARAIAKANGVDDRIRVVNGLSTEIDLPERADILITDQIGHFGFDAGLVRYAADAKRRLLKPDARLLPSAVDLWLAPVEAPDVADAIAFWNRRPGGFSMAPLHEMAMNSGYPRTLDAGQLLGEPGLGGTLDLSVDCSSVVLEAAMRITRDGTLHGLGGWFEAHLSPSVVMSNSPLAANRIVRRNVVFPIGRPVPVAAGQVVRARMRILPDESLVGWTVTLHPGMDAAPVERFEHSTLRGMLLEPARLRRTRTDYVPRLTARGEARRSVLELCDGQRPLADVERQVYERHPAMFRDIAEAAVFVAEVVTGYSV